MSPAEYAAALAAEHNQLYPLTDEQITDAARILAGVARERAQEAA